jgi:23S rRNA pseudouridine1911/1915/1917 synthase
MKKNTTDRRPVKTPDPRFIVKEECELMSFLIASMPHKNRDNIKSYLKNRQVLVDDEPVTQHNHILTPGKVVIVSRNKIAPQKTYHGISIIYEDNDLLVIDKHAGVLSVATGNKEKYTAYSLLYDHVKKNNADGKIFIVHRLDRETSGLMVFAKNSRVQTLMQKTWNDIIRERVYVALAEGEVTPPSGEISSYLKENKNRVVYSGKETGDGQWAMTRYETLRTVPGFTLLRLSLRTGRKNQIRVHLKDIGHPVAGDKKYGASLNPIGRLALHAMVLAFRHPVSGKEMRFETPVPRKFHEVI